MSKKTRRVVWYLEPELIEQVRRAAPLLSGAEGRVSQSALVEKALRSYFEREPQLVGRKPEAVA